MRILVVEARGLHIGFLGCYGNEWIATPNLDRLAAEGVVFDQHIHHEPNGQSLAESQMSGQMEFLRQEGIDDFGQQAIASWRRSKAPMVWLHGPELAPPWDLSDDLRSAYFDEEEPGEPWLDPPTDVVPSLTTDELLELQYTYAAAVTWFDAQLGIILEAMRTSGELDSSLVCITASAGLPLGEHGEIGAARAWLHEERVHIPLIMRFPRAQHAGVRVGALTQPLDLLPTFAALTDTNLGASSPAAEIPGHNLLPLVRGEMDSVRLQAISSLRIGAGVESVLRTLDWAFLLPRAAPEGDAPRSPQLYAKPEDRWEVNDVRQHNLELADDFEKLLRSALGDAAQLDK